MKKYDISGFGIVALIIVLLAIVVNHCDAQTVEHREYKPQKLKWNNHAFFAGRPKAKFLNWQDLPDTWDGEQWATWGAFALSGAMWGMREAYHADPYVFEKRWRVGETSFFGSDAWLRNYKNNDDSQPHKSEMLGNFGRDIHHTFGIGSKVLLVGGTFTIGARAQPIKYRVANLALAWLLNSGAASIAYQLSRR